MVGFAPGRSRIPGPATGNLTSSDGESWRRRVPAWLFRTRRLYGNGIPDGALTKKEADPKGQLLAFIRIVSECDDRYCRGHHSHYSLQIIQTFPACCSMTNCRCRAPSRYPYQLVDTHTQPLSSSRHSHVKNIATLLIIKGIAIVFV